MTTYPTSIQDMDAGRGTSGQPLSAPNHITHHTTEDDTIEALQVKVGVDNSAVTSSIDYKLSNTASINPGHRHTLDNLSDVNTSGAISGDFLSYNGSDWVAASTTAPDASTTVKGVSKLSTAPVSPTNPISVGDNDTRVPTQGENDALVGNNTDIAVGTGNKFVTQTGLQHNAEKYGADAGGTDAYAITLSPAPTSYTNGMVVYFKANTANTGTATINVNGLGAKTIVKGVNTTLDNGDISANQLSTLIYDGTNFVLQSVSIASRGLFSSGDFTKQENITTSDVIAHGLGLTPKRVKVTAMYTNVASTINLTAVTTYNGTTQSSVAQQFAASGGVTNTFALNSSGIGLPGSGLVGTVTFDATDITIAWSGGASTNVWTLVWEAEA